MSGRVNFMIKNVPASSAFAVACLAIAVFSGMDAVMKGVSIVIGAYNAMLWRALAAVLISGALFIARRSPWPDRPTLLLHIQRSIATGLSVLLFFWGLVRIAMAEGVALTFLSPLIAALLAVPMLGEKIRPRAILACIVAFAGVLVIVAGKAGKGAGPAALHGALAIVAASLLYAYNLVLLRRSALRSGPVEITFFTNLVMTILYGVAAPVAGIVPPAGQWGWIVLGAALAIVSSLLLSWAYAHAETQRLVTVEYSAFLWAAILGALVFGETVGPLTLIGAAMIIAGCVIAARRGAGPVAGIEAAA